jgi:hypothetical protein
VVLKGLAWWWKPELSSHLLTNHEVDYVASISAQ